MAAFHDCVVEAGRTTLPWIGRLVSNVHLPWKHIIKTVTAHAAYREFQYHYNLESHDCALSCHTINTEVENFEETGSTLKKKPLGAP